METRDFNTLGNILGAYKAGDTVDVEFYRGAEKKIVPMKLSGRPIPEIPATVKELADKVSEIYTNSKKDLTGVLKGVTEKETAYKLNTEEWSIKEILAHLIHSERGTQDYIQYMVGAYEPIFEGGENLPARITATLKAFPTFQALLNENLSLMD